MVYVVPVCALTPPIYGVVNVRFVAASPLGNVVDSAGMPPLPVTSTLLFAVASPATTFAELEYRS
jgi:hypothetical protein